MKPVDETAVFDVPELQDAVNQVFGLSGTDIAVCCVLREMEPARVDELTECLDRDRSTISRSLSHLTDLRFVKEDSDIPEGGGQVKVYTMRPMEEIHRRIRLGLYSWVEEIVDQVDEGDQERLQMMAEEQAALDTETIQNEAEEEDEPADVDRSVEQTELQADRTPRSLLKRVLHRRWS